MLIPKQGDIVICRPTSRSGSFHREVRRRIEKIEGNQCWFVTLLENGQPASGPLGPRPIHALDIVRIETLPPPTPARPKASSHVAPIPSTFDPT